MTNFFLPQKVVNQIRRGVEKQENVSVLWHNIVNRYISIEIFVCERNKFVASYSEHRIVELHWTEAVRLRMNSLEIQLRVRCRIETFTVSDVTMQDWNRLNTSTIRLDSCESEQLLLNGISHQKKDSQN